jgi:DNA-binding MarR family transcriptional regulator
VVTHDLLIERLDMFMHRVFKSRDLNDANEMADLELTFSQARALMVLSISDRPLSIGEIAEELSLTLASAGRNVDRLVRAGLVERRESCADRRVKLVALSATGAELSRRQHDRGREALRRLIAPLSEDDAQRLVAALAPLVEPGDSDADLPASRSLTASRKTSS